MTILSKEIQKEYFDSHLPHRLTLLLTLRNAKAREFDIQKQGDFYRCAKDSNLMAVRLFMDFFQLKGQKNNNIYSLILNTKYYDDDIKIDKFIGRTLEVEDVPPNMRRTLAGVYKRADKELAHLTTQDKYNDEFNTDEKLIEAAESIEYLLKEFLYGNEKIQMPFPELNDNFYY